MTLVYIVVYAIISGPPYSAALIQLFRNVLTLEFLSDGSGFSYGRYSLAACIA